MFRDTREQGKISVRMMEGKGNYLPVYASFLSLDYKKRNLKPMVLLYGTDWVLGTKNLLSFSAFRIFEFEPHLSTVNKH